jgi:hypothetical protein
MRILNSLYVQGYGAKLSLQKGSLLVTRRDATRVRVPIESLDGVVLLGSALVTGCDCRPGSMVRSRQTAKLPPPSAAVAV